MGTLQQKMSTLKQNKQKTIFSPQVSRFFCFQHLLIFAEIEFLSPKKHKICGNRESCHTKYEWGLKEMTQSSFLRTKVLDLFKNFWTNFLAVK